jgi:hypothetical protein
LDLTISTGTVVTILGILGGGGILGLVGKLYALRKQLDDKRDEKSCTICRSEVDARLQGVKDWMTEALDDRASKNEVTAHAALLAQHSTELEVLKTKLDALGQSSKRVEQLLERLLEKD